MLSARSASVPVERFFSLKHPTIAVKYNIEKDRSKFWKTWRDANRMQFSGYLMRQNHLVIDGWLWYVLRFS